MLALHTQLVILRVLGKGTWGTVYEGVCVCVCASARVCVCAVEGEGGCTRMRATCVRTAHTHTRYPKWPLAGLRVCPLPPALP